MALIDLVDSSHYWHLAVVIELEKMIQSCSDLTELGADYLMNNFSKSHDVSYLASFLRLATSYIFVTKTDEASRLLLNEANSLPLDLGFDSRIVYSRFISNLGRYFD